MRFYSTRNRSVTYSLSEAVLQGLAPDGGLFMPVTVPVLPAELIRAMRQMSLPELACEVASPFLEEDMPRAALEDLVRQAIPFDAPLVQLDQRTWILELFHGPTLAFKDFGARFMARLMAHLIRGSGQPLTILVATSGDTGSAVAGGFFRVEGIDVVILYPSKKVSPLQEAQLTTLGHNIRAVEVEGTFDDCQRMVKQAFLDAELRAACRLTSANSINISRLIPQSFYYFRAVTQLPDGLPPVLSVPSGNFGNLTAGVFARHMGLPVHRLIAATNSNAVFPHYLESGHFEPAPSVHTLSNAMDVGHPSNFERLQDIYHDSAEEMRREISSYAFDDAATAEKMQAVYRQYGYLLDPHGAVGLLGWEAWRAAQPTDAPGIVFETAHPAKFGEVIRQVLGIDPPLPPALAAAAARGKQATRMENNYARLKEFLLAAR